jgi:Recombination endonuclease VII
MTKEEKRLYDRNWYAANRENRIAYAQKYNKEHPETHKVHCRTWRVTHRVQHAASLQKWRKALSPEKRKSQWLKSKYNITFDEYTLILAAQDGLCAGCKQPAAHFKRALHVDHDHSPSHKIVRGLLCWRCNSMLPARGNLKELLTNLVTYLNDPPATRALGEERKMK